jgi:CMP/dCMP kinase
MIITIDGPAGTGKSTVAKKLAERLGVTYFDTGALYRCVALAALNKGVDPHDEVAIEKMLLHFSFSIKVKGGEKHYVMEGQDVTQAIRLPAVNAVVSAISALKTVRATLLKVQRDFGAKGSAVFEGRDVGSVVFPGAEVKIFLTARPEVRAQRRRDEMILKQPETRALDLEKMQAELERRDHLDSTRALSPLKCPEGAYQIDTSDLTIDEVVDTIVKYVKQTEK